LICGENIFANRESPTCQTKTEGSRARKEKREKKGVRAEGEGRHVRRWALPSNPPGGEKEEKKPRKEGPQQAEGGLKIGKACEKLAKVSG